MVSALDTLSKLEELNSKMKLQYSFDIGVLESLKFCCEEKLNDAAEILSSLESSKKEGYIFKKKDLMWYISFVHFLAGDYQKALKSMTLLEMDYYGKDNALLPPDEEDSFNILFLDSNEREGQFYVSTKSITHPELVFNLAVCQLMLKNIDKAYLKLASLSSLPQVARKIFRLMTRLKKYVSAETLTKAKTLTSKYQPNQSHLSDDEEELAHQMFLDSSDKLSDNPELCPFPVENRLCSIYPLTSLILDMDDELELRLSFCLPAIKLSEIKIDVGYEELLKINLRSIEYKPEAPWIKKLDDRIIFTNHVTDDEVVEYNSPADLIDRLRASRGMPINTQVKLNVQQAYQHNLELHKAALLKPKHDEDHDESMDEHDFDEDDEEEEEPEKPDLAKLKRQLMLDDRTNEVLSKLKK